MIIRSQDKRGFVNLANIDTVCVSSEWEIFAFDNNAKSFIGIYSTEEKAIKALDMIQQEYLQPIYQNVIDENEVAIYKNKVFQMPQDSEV